MGHAAARWSRRRATCRSRWPRWSTRCSSSAPAGPPAARRRPPRRRWRRRRRARWTPTRSSPRAWSSSTTSRRGPRGGGASGGGAACRVLVCAACPALTGAVSPGPQATSPAAGAGVGLCHLFAPRSPSRRLIGSQDASNCKCDNTYIFSVQTLWGCPSCRGSSLVGPRG